MGLEAVMELKLAARTSPLLAGSTTRKLFHMQVKKVPFAYLNKLTFYHIFKIINMDLEGLLG
jgi:hypothetical protein